MNTKLHIANPGDYADPRLSLFSFQFGAYGLTKVLAFARSCDGALEEAAGYLASNNLSGLFYQPDYECARKELGDGASDEMVREKAETDLTYTESGYLASWEVHFHESSEGLQGLVRQRCERLDGAE